MSPISLAVKSMSYSPCEPVDNGISMATFASYDNSEGFDT